MSYLDLEDLYTEKEDLLSAKRDPAEDPDGHTFDDDDAERLYALEGVCDELSLDDRHNRSQAAIPDWDWLNYAESLADDLGMVDGDSPMASYIDWERWADDLKMDYTSFEFEGIEYWVRL